MENEVNQKPEASMESPVKVSDYSKKFKKAEDRMKSEFLPKYELAKRRLRSEHSTSGRGSKKMTHEQVNLVYSIGSNFVNSVYYKSPECNLTAREEQDHQKIENTEIQVNDWLKDKKVKRIVRRSVWDGYLGGLGAAMVDYIYNDMEDQSNILNMQVDPETGQQIPPEVPQYGRLVLKNEITIQRIRPDLLRFPEGFDIENHDDAPWVGFEMIHPIDWIKSQNDWDAEVRDKIKGSQFSKLSKSDRAEYKDSEGDDLYGKISYVFIKPENDFGPYKLLIFSRDSDEKPLYFADFDKGHKGCPIKFINFNPIDDDYSYPCGDPWIWEAQLNAIDNWWKTFVRHVKRSNPKTAYDAGAVNPQELQKLKSNDDNAFVGLKNTEKRDLRTLFAELNSPSVHKDFDQLWDVARQLIGELAPKTNLSRGQEGGSDTATEAKIVQAGEMIDVDARIDVVRDFITEIVLDVCGILEKSLAYPLPLQRPVTDGLGNETNQYDEVGAEGYTSKINVDVDVESMQAQNKDVIRRQLIDMLGIFQKLSPFFQAIGEQPDPKWWIERIMETSNIRNIDKAFVKVNPMPMVPGQPGQPNQGAPQSPTVGGDMPPEAIEAGQAVMA